MNNKLTESEKRPLPVEELFRDSPNDVLRRMALRIIYAKREAKDRFFKAGMEIISSPILMGTGVMAVSNARQWGDVGLGVLMTGVSFMVGCIGIGDFASSSQLRGEANSLTTALACEIIAVSKVEVKIIEGILKAAEGNYPHSSNKQPLG